MNITFVYKGRYQVRDAVTIEYLSSLAKQHGHATCLVYDPDLFGVTDNVYSNRMLNRLVSKEKRITASIKSKGAGLVVFLDGFTRRAWNASIALSLSKNYGYSTVLISHAKDKTFFGSYKHQLYGEPEAVFERFLASKAYDAQAGEFLSDVLVDLERLPFPDKTLFAPYVNFKDSYMIYSSKGCPYHCSYCEETVYKIRHGSGYFRRMSPSRVIRELAGAKATVSMREVIFKDAVFALDKLWLREFLAAYQKQINVPFKCFAKPEIVDQEIAQLLKESRCYCVEFGLQTFNEQLKQTILQRPEKTKVLLDAFSLCAQCGLSYDIDYLFGIPGESAQDHCYAAGVFSSLRKLNRIKCHNLAFFQGADIFQHAPPEVKNNPAYNADFFSAVAGSGAMVEVNKAFQKYFKILPLLPRRFNAWVSTNNHWKIFKIMPGLLILLGMGVLALKNGDIRFSVYLLHYAQKIRRTVFQ